MADCGCYGCFLAPAPAPQMCFRGLLSTSNIIASDKVEVVTDEDLLWITAIGDSIQEAAPAPQQQH